MKTINRMISGTILLIVISAFPSCTKKTSTYLPEAFKFDGWFGAVSPWGSWVTDGPVYAITRSGSNIYFGGQFASVYANSGGGAVLDNTNGMIPPGGNVPYVDGYVYAAVPDNRGGWYIGGSFSRVGNRPRMNIAHIRPDGSVDDWNPVANAEIVALAVSGNIVYAGGNFNVSFGPITIGGRARNYIAALDAGTGVATDWDPNPNDVVWTVAVSGSTVYAGGEFTNIGGAARNYIAALNNTDGAAIVTWDPNANNPVYVLLVNSDSVYVGGEFNTSLGTPTIGGQARNFLAELDAVSTPAATGAATAWNPDSNNVITSMALSGTDLAVGGYFSTIGGQSRQYLAFLDTTVDTNMATPWVATPGNIVHILCIQNDILYIGGEFTSVNIGGTDYTRNYAASINLMTGNITNWDPNADGYVYIIKAVSDRVYVGGQFLGICRRGRNNLAAVDTSTGILSAWDPNADNTVRALVADGGTIYAGGLFTLFDGVTDRYFIAALDIITGDPTPWNPGCDGPVYSIAVDSSAVYAGGNFSQIINPDFSTANRLNIAAINKSTGFAMPAVPAGSGWDLGANGIVNAMALDGSILYAGGGFTTINGATRSHLAALYAPAGDPTSWAADANNDVNALAVYGGLLYTGGNFTTLSGTTRTYLGCVSTASGIVTTWNPAPDGIVYALKVSDDRLFVGGNFTTMGVAPPPPITPPVNYIAMFDLPSGTLDNFRTHPDSTVFAIDVSGSALYLGGSYMGINGSPMPYLSAVNIWHGGPVGY